MNSRIQVFVRDNLFHGIIESLRLEKTSKISKPNHHPNTTMTTEPCSKVPRLHVFLNTSSDGDSTTSLGSLFQCLTTLSVQKSKPPLMQLEAISSCPITHYLGEETNTQLATTSFRVVVESKKVPPEPPLLQTKPPQFPQLLLIRLVLQTLHQLCCHSLNTLQHLHVLLVVSGPKLNTVLEVWLHQR